jgi:hypothetical protein
VIAREIGDLGSDEFSSVLEARAAPNMQEPLVKRIQYWRSQGVRPVVLIARIDNAGSRLLALKELAPFCNPGNE